jgi:4-amino-4-deoxy-L-arabinose transferase-like glycosyltransferase
MQLFLKAHAGILLLCLVMTGAYVTGYVYLEAFYAAEGKTYPIIESDSAEYLLLAENLLQHGVFSLSPSSPFEPETFRVPGYPLFVAAVVATFGSLDALIILQILLLAGCAFLVFLLADIVSSSRAVAYLAAGLFALSPNTPLFGVMVLSEPFFVFLFLLSTYLLLSVAPHYEKRVAWAGALLGAAALVRTVAIYLPIFSIAATLVFRRWKSRPLLLATLFLGFFVFVVFPWVARNKAVSGEWGVSSTTAVNFYYYYVPLFLKHESAVGAKQITADIPLDSIPEDRKMDLASAPVLQSKSVDVILQSPLKYLQFHIKDISAFMEGSALRNGWEALIKPLYVSTHGKSEVFALENRVLRAAVVEGFVLHALWWMALLSIVFIKRKDAYALMWAQMLWFFVAAGPVAAFTTRYRVPAEPFLFILSSVGIVGLAKVCLAGATGPQSFYRRLRKVVAQISARVEKLLHLNKD